MSAPILRIGDLEINQDLRVQKTMWRLQRIGWALMAVMVLLGAAGLFGHGSVSRASGGDQQGPLWIEYERFGRYQGMSELRIHVRATRGSEAIRIWIGPDYAGHVDIQQIMPWPVKSAIADGGLVFEVTVIDQDAPGIITLLLQFRDIGWVAGEIRASGIDPIPVRHFIYP